MPLCWKCSRPVGPDSSFCMNCGAGLNAETSAPGRSLPPRPAPPAPGTVQMSIPLAPETDKKRTKKDVPPQFEQIIVEDNKQADAAVAGLAKYYREYVKPIEIAYKFDAFHSPFLTDTDFHANPMVLLIGQYSTGKTSFIQYIIERDFQGMRIGPEPTTDKFTAVIYGDEDREIPGNALAAMSTQPFTALQKFGIGFLNRFEASMCNSPILEKLTFIDTPGVLSGEKQRVDRSYNFPEVVEWFAGRADRILLLFDANKLDISDEFKTTIEALKGNDDKIRCVLNKADSVSPQQLMRVYGALMWSLGRVVRTPEVLRVYTGSFWSQPLQKGCQEELLLKEEADLLADLRSLPRNAAIRKVNEFVKRARQIKVHALICEHLRSQFGFFGKEKMQKKMLDNLLEEFKTVQKKFGLPIGDFPHLGKFRDTIKLFEIHKFPPLDQKRLDKLDWVLAEGIPALMKMLPLSRDYNSGGSPFSPASTISEGHGLNKGAEGVEAKMPLAASPSPSSASSSASGTAALGAPPPRPGSRPGPVGGVPPGGVGSNPFEDEPDSSPIVWSIGEAERSRLTTDFYNLKLASSKLSGSHAKAMSQQFSLAGSDLKKIWDHADLDRDGYLDIDEFILFMHLVEKRKRTNMPVPDMLDPTVVPPSKRTLFFARYGDQLNNLPAFRTHHVTAFPTPSPSTTTTASTPAPTSSYTSAPPVAARQGSVPQDTWDAVAGGSSSGSGSGSSSGSGQEGGITGSGVGTEGVPRSSFGGEDGR